MKISDAIVLWILVISGNVTLHTFQVSSRENFGGDTPRSLHPDFHPLNTGYRTASVEDLKKSEKYLRQDLGLDDPSEEEAGPLWKIALKKHYILVPLSALMFLGGVVGFILIYKKQNRILNDGLMLARKNAGKFTGSSGKFLNTPPLPIQQIIAEETLEIQSLSKVPVGKVSRKVDSVLDSLRNALGPKAAVSRISLYRLEEVAKTFRVCGFSHGDDFKTFNPVLSPPDEIFSCPIRTLSPFTSRPVLGKESQTGWVYPFVAGSGNLCALILEMNQGQPPEKWSDYILGSLDLVKALIVRQESSKDDVILSTKDDSGSLDYRGTMNRLLEECGKSTKMGVPFTVILIRVTNNGELTKLLGGAQIEKVWTRLIDFMKSLLRTSDWVMRPESDLIVIQILEAGNAEGQVVLRRLLKEFRKTEITKILDRPIHYQGVMMSYPIDTNISINGFFDQILHRFEERADFEGDYYFK